MVELHRLKVVMLVVVVTMAVMVVVVWQLFVCTYRLWGFILVQLAYTIGRCSQYYVLFIEILYYSKVTFFKM